MYLYLYIGVDWAHFISIYSLVNSVHVHDNVSSYFVIYRLARFLMFVC